MCRNNTKNVKLIIEILINKKWISKSDIFLVYAN